MVSSTPTPLLELQTQLWKARAQAKQTWLERTLAEPATTPQETARRATWITRALNTVKRGQAELKYRAALIDTYTDHLSVLELTLMRVAEPAAGSANDGSGR